MLTLTHALNALLMLAMPLLLGAYLARRGQPWGLFGAGMAVFVASQVVHIPLNAGVARLFEAGALPPVSPELKRWLLPLGLGLSAGLCEELARYVALKRWIRQARSWGQGLMVGAGHGGVESMILGAMVSLSFLQMVVLRSTEGLPADIVAQVDAYWGVHWAYPMLGALERALTIPCHVAATVMVVQVFQAPDGTGNRWRWLIAAIAAHTALDAGAVALVSETGSVLYAEAWVAAFTVAGIGLLIKLRPEPTADDAYTPVEQVALTRRPLTSPPAGAPTSHPERDEP